MRNLLHLAWAFIEKIVPRVSSSVLLLALAVYTDPSTVGMFAAVTLGLTFYQGVAESSIRQVAMVFTNSRSSRAKLRRLLRYASLGGVVIIAVIIGILFWTNQNHDANNVWLLAPMMLVPLVTSLGIMPMVDIQRADRWYILAKYRVWSSILALICCIPVLFMISPLISSVIYPVLSESIFTLQVRRGSKVLPIGNKQLFTNRSIRRELISLILYRGLSWCEGQADRVLIGSLAGTAVLGHYSTSVALGRSGGDAITESTANVLRSRLANLPVNATNADWKNVVAKTMTPGPVVCGMGVVALWAACEFVFPLILSSSWAPTLRAAPIIALATLPAFFTGSLSTIVAVRGAAWNILPVRIIGILISVPIGFLAIHNIESAAWIVVLREIVVAAGIGFYVKQVIPPRLVVVSASILIVLAFSLGLR